MTTMFQEALSNHDALFAEQNGSVNGIGLSVYLAARYSRKEEIKQKAEELRQLGIVVTSRWLEEKADPNCNLKDFGDDYHLDVAITDIADIDRADVVVLFTESPEEAYVRGGRHFESGYAYGAGKPLITIGPRENIFHYLNRIVNVPTWEGLKHDLVFLGKVRKI